MSYFKPEPKVILATREDLLRALEHPEEWSDWQGPNAQFETRSVWLCELIQRMQTELGRHLLYNSEIFRRAHALLGLPPADFYAAGVESGPLSTLIYNAQGYVHSDYLRAAGFEPFTSEVLLRAHAAQAKVQVGSVLCTPKEIQGQWFALLPRSRRRGYRPDVDNPVKVVCRGETPDPHPPMLGSF